MLIVTIGGDTVCELYGTFVKEIYLYIFYCLVFFEDTPVRIILEQVVE